MAQNVKFFLSQTAFWNGDLTNGAMEAPHLIVTFYLFIVTNLITV